MCEERKILANLFAVIAEFVQIGYHKKSNINPH